MLFSLMFIIQAGHAQKGWEVGLGVGVSHYFGDLNTSYDLTELGPSTSIWGRYNFGHRVCLKGAFGYGFIYGDDQDSPNLFEQTRNLDFRSHIFDFMFSGEFNFLPLTHGSRYEYFTPYLVAGVGVLHYNPYTFLDETKYLLQPLGTEGQANGDEYSRVTPTFLIGGGFKWDINYEWSINIEYGYRSTFTDYLDDVSGTYPAFQEILAERGEVAAELYDRSVEPKIGQPGRQRGDVIYNDNYGFLQISIVRFFGQVECPKISKKNAASWL